MAEGTRMDYGVVLTRAGRAPAGANSPRCARIEVLQESGVFTGMPWRVARGEINYTDDGTTVTVCTVPDKSIVRNVWIEVVTAFNGGATNTVEIGDGSDANGFVTTTIGAIGSTGLKALNHYDHGVYLWEDTEDSPLLKYYATADTIDAAVVSTAGASAGKAYIYVEYMTLDDLDPAL